MLKKVRRWFEIESLWKFVKKGNFDIPLFGFFNFPATDICSTRVKGFYLFGFSFEWCTEIDKKWNQPNSNSKKK